MMLYISESVLHFIQTEIANHPPERSGAILGPVGQVSQLSPAFTLI
ncbi:MULTISPECIES: hypothetical protein [unclassified Microcoleus]